jgi:hypothetical protein
MSRPVVALLTDFGLHDHYVGVMKGVVLSGCPEATLVDITHDVPPQDIVAGALELAAAWRYFPHGTVFLVVVDPGVGSARHRLAVEAGGCHFVGPDNGVLALALDEAGRHEAVALTTRGPARFPASRTFDGRDWFGPAAARLAAGTPLRDLGPPIGAIAGLELPRPRLLDGGVIEGEVLRVDRFGNLITNLDRSAVDRPDSPMPRVQVGARVVGGVVSTYADVDSGSLCALFGSTGYLEIACAGGSAAAALGAGRGAAVRVLRRA